MSRTFRILGIAAVAALVGGLYAVQPMAAAGGSVAGTVKAGGQASENTVVYIAHAGGTFQPPAKKPVMDQHSKKFIPHVLPILLGTAVEYHNQDSFKHNVFSPDYGGWNLGAWGQGATKDYAYKTCKKFPCVYRQECLIHREMLAYVVVLQNPYFATTSYTGQYSIKDVPAGAYTLEVWHEGKLTGAPQKITVQAGKTATVNFALK